MALIDFQKWLSATTPDKIKVRSQKKQLRRFFKSNENYLCMMIGDIVNKEQINYIPFDYFQSSSAHTTNQNKKHYCELKVQHHIEKIFQIYHKNLIYSYSL